MTLVNRMVDARPCNVIDMLRRVRNSRTIIIIIIIIIIVVVDVDLQYWTSKIQHVATFTAIFSTICTAHAKNGYL